MPTFKVPTTYQPAFDGLVTKFGGDIIDISDKFAPNGSDYVAVVTEAEASAMRHLYGPSGAKFLTELSQSYNAQVVADGAAAFWPMSDTSGNIVETIGAKTATSSGGVTYSQPSLLHSSHGGTSIQTNTTLLTVGDQFDLVGTASYTMEGWIKPTTMGAGTFTDLFQKRFTQAGPIYDGYITFITNSTGAISHQRLTSSPNVTHTTGPGGGAILVNTTYHIAVTYDGTTMRLYKNGVQVSANASNMSLVNTATTLTLLGTLTGYAERFALYTSALTADQVHSHYVLGKYGYS